MTERFTVEEINLMCIFDTRNRNELKSELITIVESFKENDPLSDDGILEIAQNTIEKISKMTAAEFDALEFYPIYEEPEVSD